MPAKRDDCRRCGRWSVVVLWMAALLLPGCRHRLAPAANLTGYWAFRVPNGGTGYFELKQDGSALRGTDIGLLKLPLQGEIHGREFHLTASFTQAGHRLEVRYDGSVQPQGIAMTEQKPVTTNGGGEMVIRGTLERTTRSVIFPAPLPLPPLKDLAPNGLAKLPPMGWNSWNKFHTMIDDRTVREMADALVASGMSRMGYKYVLIDGGWQGSRDAQGNLQGNARFPDMKALADSVHSKGLKIGIYSTPGPRSCGGYEGSFGHEAQDAKQFAAWGFDYLKYDWCSASLVYRFRDKRAVYQKMAEALRASGRPMVYSLSAGSPGIWKWAPKAGANLWRTGGDITNTWASIEKIGFSQPAIASYAGPGHWNDPDNLEVGNAGVSDEEGRTQMSLWALLRAPLIAGNDLRSMTPATREILTNAAVIAIDQDRLALPLKQVVDEPSIKVYVRKLWGSDVALGIFNTADQPAETKILWRQVGLRAAADAGRLRALDVWSGKRSAVGGDGYTASVPAHGVVLLRLSQGQAGMAPE
ncbi:MAG: glycoside hydrolase family 27 protein [Acidobacteriaceae bacterium]